YSESGMVAEPVGPLIIDAVLDVRIIPEELDHLPAGALRVEITSLPGARRRDEVVADADPGQHLLASHGHTMVARLSLIDCSAFIVTTMRISRKSRRALSIGYVGPSLLSAAISAFVDSWSAHAAARASSTLAC